MSKIMYSYKDIVLLPEYSEFTSRTETNKNVKFLDRTFNSVAIPANMKCTINFSKAVELAEQQYFYVLHRFYDYEKIFNWIKHNQDIFISISVGVKQQDYDFISKLAASNYRVDYITVDVAHGHHILVKNIIKHIKNCNWTTGVMPKIIAGNIGTRRAALDLREWGADAVKIGLSMGKSCTTYNCTGVGTPMFSAVQQVCFTSQNEYNPPLPVIADGQIREVGDICKALVAGASMVMVGSEFAKCSDSPADTLDNMKIFFGSASSFNKDGTNFIEGQKVLLEQRTENYFQFLKRINEGVQSCMSYAGVLNTNELHEMQYAIRTC